MAIARWNGSSWTTLTTLERWTGSAWTAISNIYRWSGSAWVKVWPTTTSVTLYQSTTASTTLSTANQLLTTTSTETHTNTATTGVSPHDSCLIASQGGTQTTSNSPPPPDGKGWLWDVTTLEGKSIQAGTVTVAGKFYNSGFYALSVAARLYVRSSGGTYTSIASAAASTTIGSGATTTVSVSLTVSTTVFSTGDKLYLDWTTTETGAYNGYTYSCYQNASTERITGITYQ